ncbi:MAG: hypothetical protein IPM64_05320 [Phycisphaerales bacterium]|nr:hypothetical protein [Phycisphaerales bacterium]
MSRPSAGFRAPACLALLALTLAGCTAPSRTFVAPELRVAAANADIRIHPLLIIADGVVHDPHEAARFGESLRRLGMGALRLSPHRVDAALDRRHAPGEILSRTEEALRARVRSDPSGGEFALIAVYVLDKRNHFDSLHAVAVRADGAAALRLSLSHATPGYRERPPTLMYEAADRLATAVADELGLARP